MSEETKSLSDEKQKQTLSAQDVLKRSWTIPERFVVLMEEFLSNLFTAFPNCDLTKKKLTELQLVVKPVGQLKDFVTREYAECMKLEKDDLVYSACKKRDSVVLFKECSKFLNELDMITKFNDSGFCEDEKDALWSYLCGLNCLAKLHHVIPASFTNFWALTVVELRRYFAITSNNTKTNPTSHQAFIIQLLLNSVDQFSKMVTFHDFLTILFKRHELCRLGRDVQFGDDEQKEQACVKLLLDYAEKYLDSPMMQKAIDYVLLQAKEQGSDAYMNLTALKPMIATFLPMVLMTIEQRMSSFSSSSSSSSSPSDSFADPSAALQAFISSNSSSSGVDLSSLLASFTPSMPSSSSSSSSLANGSLNPALLMQMMSTLNQKKS